MNEQNYINYYIEVLTSTMTDAIVRNVSLQAQSKSLNEVIENQSKQLDEAYNVINSLKDEIVEKIMGYTGTRTKAMPVDTIKDYAPGMAEQVVNELQIFSKQLEAFGESNGMPDIENIAQSLSGDAAQTKYRLTLS